MTSIPAQAGRRTGRGCVVRIRRGTDGREARQCHFRPAASVRAMVARSDTAMVKRARFAFTTLPLWLCIPSDGHRQPGGLPDGRSLALRPRLATGLPWTEVNGSEHRFGTNVAVGRTAEPCIGSTPAAAARVSARTHRDGDQAGAPPFGSGAAVTIGARPCIAATIAIVAPIPIRTSPTLKMLAIGSQAGIANTSVSGPSTAPSR